MKKVIPIALFTLIAGMAIYAPMAQASPEEYCEGNNECEVLFVESTVQNNIVKRVVTIKTGWRANDKFTYQRTVLADASGNPLPFTQLEGAVVLAPGGASSTAMYDLEPGGMSLIEYLASYGLDVYTYNSRTTGMNGAQCLLANNIIGEWGMQRYVDDVRIIGAIAWLTHLFQAPAIGGLSLGAMVSIASLNDPPILWNWRKAAIMDGTLYYADPDLQAVYQIACDDYTQKASSGIRYDSLSYLLLTSLWHAYLDNPNGVSIWSIGACEQSCLDEENNPRYCTNDECMHLVATQPQQPPVAEAPDYVYLAGQINPNMLYYADEDLMTAAVDQFNTCEPYLLMSNYYCCFTGICEFTDNLDSYDGDILAVKTGMGFGPHMDDNLDLLENANIQELVVSQYGHADVMVAADQDMTIWPTLRDFFLAP